MATEYAPNAFASRPMAVEVCPDAIEAYPLANELQPDADVELPMFEDAFAAEELPPFTWIPFSPTIWALAASPRKRAKDSVIIVLTLLNFVFIIAVIWCFETSGFGSFFHKLPFLDLPFSVVDTVGVHSCGQAAHAHGEHIAFATDDAAHDDVSRHIMDADAVLAANRIRKIWNVEMYLVRSRVGIDPALQLLLGHLLHADRNGIEVLARQLHDLTMGLNQGFYK